MDIETTIGYLATCVVNASEGNVLRARLGTFIEFSGSDKGEFSVLKQMCLETAKTVLGIDEPDEAVLRRADGHDMTLGAARAELKTLAEAMQSSWAGRREPGY